MNNDFDKVITAKVKDFAEPAEPVAGVVEEDTTPVAPAAVGAGVSEPAIPLMSSVPQFKVVDVSTDAIAAFAREYNPQMNMVNCIGNREALLSYMVDMERLYGITMSFPAYGIDPIIFDKEVEARGLEVAELEIPVSAEEPALEDGEEAVTEDTDPELRSDRYEKISVDGVLYLSCVTRCLDEGYLHKVIAEATESLYTHGKYVFTLVGPRPLVYCGEAQGTFIETLKLNSYELSALLAYVGGIAGVEVHHVIYDGRAAIEFKKV